MKEVEVISAVHNDSLSSLFSRREEFRLSLATPTCFIPELAIAWLDALGTLRGRNGELINAKGRDKGDPLLITGDHGLIADHELFYLGGHTVDSGRGQSFALSLNAKFLEIKANRDYHFSISPYFQNSASLEISPFALTYSSGVAPSTLRGSVQFYKETFFSSMLGSFPKVTESIQFEMSGGFCNVIVWATVGRSGQALPERRSFGLISKAISESMELDIGHLYNKAIFKTKD